MTWFYHQNGENKGPLGVMDLRALRAQGQLDDETLVWEQGMPGWVPYHTSSAASSASVPAPVAVAMPAGATTSASAFAHLSPCSECGKQLPEADLIAYEDKRICPSCKPLFFQRIREGVQQHGAFRYATVLARFGAVFLDGILIDLVVLGPIMVFYGVGALTITGRSHMSPVLQIFATAAQYLIPALYEIIMVAQFGATLGKMAAKVQVVTEDGARLGYGRSTGRHFAKILSSLILGIGYLMAIWDPEKRALHDRICGTRVITTSSV
jgi:uncharacterized RDD family membrane protein YckC